MTIRKRLASFFILMTGLMVLIGGLSVLGGPIIVGAFRQSIESMNSLNTIREVRSSVSRQNSSLNRYLLLDEGQELITAEEAAAYTKKVLSQFKQDDSHAPEWHSQLTTLWTQTNAEADEVVSLYKKGRKTKALDMATTSLIPGFQKTVQYLDALEIQKSEEAKSMYNISRELSEKAGLVVLVVVCIAFLLGLVLFRSLYRAVMTPLESLKNGATMFGKGDWDYKIEMSSSNEFGALATSFNKMAENVKQLQRQAIHMDRMSAVGQLAGGVAHEINNPLTGVLGQAQILLAKSDPESKTFAQLKKIEQAALRCKKIVRGLLDFSRPSQTKFDSINVNDIVNATLDLCEADIKKAKVGVLRKLHSNLPKVAGNSSELQQVLLNLTNNAIQAMPNGGTLTMETITHNNPVRVIQSSKQGGRVRHLEGEWVEIIVRDSGIGIDRNHVDKVFEPFFTTKEIGKGTGLGLSVSMGIVEKHGGALRVESPGLKKGSSFHLSLPIKTVSTLKRAA